MTKRHDVQVAAEESNMWVVFAWRMAFLSVALPGAMLPDHIAVNVQVVLFVGLFLFYQHALACGHVVEHADVEARTNRQPIQLYWDREQLVEARY